MADIFLSYAKNDRSRARAVVTALEHLGFSVWWDERLTPSESWDRLIEQEIADAKAVVVLWTPSSFESDWVRLEANYGKENKKLVQARMDDCNTPLAFSMLQRAELLNWQAGQPHSGWDKLVEWISQATGVIPDKKTDAPTGRSSEDVKAANIKYWETFSPVAASFSVQRPLSTPVKGNNYYLYLSKKPEVCVAAYISRARTPSVGVYGAMWGDQAAAIFSALRTERIGIEADFGSALEWTQQGPQTFWILSTLRANPDDSSDWPRQHLWIADAMARLRTATDPRLKTILPQLGGLF